MQSALTPFILLSLPLAEIATFIVVGNYIGVWFTLLLVLLTSAIGAILLKVQGFGVLERIRQMGPQEGVPGKDLMHGAMIFLAGMFLILPGFLTDVIGFLLFIPAVREMAWGLFRHRFTVAEAGQGFYAGNRHDTAGKSSQVPRTIELDDEDFTRQDDGPPPSDRPKGSGL